MVQRNPYEKLRHDENIWPYSPENFSHLKVADLPPESVDLYTAEIASGKYSYGYIISFMDGREARKEPGDLSGWFSSRTDAELYFLGYMIRYQELFSHHVIRCVKKLIVDRIQNSLFIG